MAYDETPAAENVKCIVGTLVLAGGYMVLPTRNKWVLATIAYFVYIFIADYDYAYQCQRKLGPSLLGDFYDAAKPQDSEQVRIWKNWDPKIKQGVQVFDVAVFVVLLLLLPAFLAWDPDPTKTPAQKDADNAAALGFFALCTAITIGFRVYTDRNALGGATSAKTASA